jgi:hypothetical protein
MRQFSVGALTKCLTPVGRIRGLGTYELRCGRDAFEVQWGIAALNLQSTFKNMSARRDIAGLRAIMPRAISTLFILVVGCATAGLIGGGLSWLIRSAQGALGPDGAIPSHWGYLVIGLFLGLVGAAIWEFVRLGHFRRILHWLKSLKDHFVLVGIAGALCWVILYL